MAASEREYVLMCAETLWLFRMLFDKIFSWLCT